ncbi:MAG: hypothetical protein HYV04_17090 [Deltaproteobacteria bacterium]|nr:hypothetical protein [Deltaproteobacteria bacterium]
MAIDLRTSLRREVSRLRREIGRRTSELTSLKGELRRHLRVSRLLGADRAGKARTRGRARRRTMVNWNNVLKALPNRFTIDDLAKQGGARSKSRLYLRQVLVRWGKQKKIKRTARAKYQKA